MRPVDCLVLLLLQYSFELVNIYETLNKSLEWRAAWKKGRESRVTKF